MPGMASDRGLSGGRAARRIAGGLGAALALLAGAASVASVASAQMVARPPGRAPLAYRDPLFTQIGVTRGIVYGEAADGPGTAERLTLDLYRPRDDRAARRPAIVLVHGGGFTGGADTNPDIVGLAEAFAHRGYDAVSIDYRLLNHGEKCGTEITASANCARAGFAAIHDGQAAVRFLRARARRYRVDPGRIAIEGASAGATVALGVGVDSGDPGESGHPGYSSRVEAAIAISGEIPHAFASLDDPGDAPVLMFNGTADRTVPFPEAQRTVADLRAGGVKVVFEPLAGAGHVPFATDGRLLTSQSLYFAYAALQLAGADPVH
jgi:acetyl esterase/lipase